MRTPPCPTACSAAERCPVAPTRRDFVARAALLLVGSAFASACRERPWSPVEPSIDSLGAKGYAVTLADYPALAHDGGIAAIPVPGGVPVGLVRRSATEFEAFWMSCPHLGTIIDVHGAGFECPNHLARFAADGSWTGGQLAGHLAPVPLVLDATAGSITLGVEPAAPPPKRMPMLLQVVVANQPRLATLGGIAIFGLGNGYPAAVVRTGESSYLALSPICPHQAYYVDPDASAGGFRCPGHGATFTELGVWTGGQQTTSLHELTSSFDTMTGTLTVTIP
jgi:Rieske Fe-S protein